MQRMKYGLWVTFCGLDLWRMDQTCVVLLEEEEIKSFNGLRPNPIKSAPGERRGKELSAAEVCHRWTAHSLHSQHCLLCCFPSQACISMLSIRQKTICRRTCSLLFHWKWTGWRQHHLLGVRLTSLSKIPSFDRVSPHLVEHQIQWLSRPKFVKLEDPTQQSLRHGSRLSLFFSN